MSAAWIAAAELQPGDLINVEAGDRVYWDDDVSFEAVEPVERWAEVIAPGETVDGVTVVQVDGAEYQIPSGTLFNVRGR